jgi:hypothetical protein
MQSSFFNDMEAAVASIILEEKGGRRALSSWRLMADDAARSAFQEFSGIKCGAFIQTLQGRKLY